jgi:hypothetical protein
VCTGFFFYSKLIKIKIQVVTIVFVIIGQMFDEGRER